MTIATRKGMLSVCGRCDEAPEATEILPSTQELIESLMG